MVDLGVKFGGVDFKNPVSVAAIAPAARWGHWPPEKDAAEVQMKLWRKLYKNGVGSITTGSIYFEDLEPCGVLRFCPISTRGFATREGFITISHAPYGTLSRTNGMEVIRRCKKEFRDMRIIASIEGPGGDGAAWADLALEAQQAGADMLELNFGCPLLMPTVGKAEAQVANRLSKKYPRAATGITVGLVPEVGAQIVRDIRRKTSLPLIVKITPELGFFGLISAISIYKQAGVTALTCDHCFLSIAPPDIYNGGKTSFPQLDTTSWGGVIGPWSRLACYRDVPAVAKYGAGMDVQACGGLVIPEHCIEIMMLGAKMVQLSSGLFWNGVSYSGRVLHFMKRYMEEQGYKSVNDFIGLGLKYVVENEVMKAELKTQAGKLGAQIDYDKCAGALCNVCMDNWCVATYMEGGQVKVDTELCNSCGLCVIRCPNGARGLEWIEN